MSSHRSALADLLRSLRALGITEPATAAEVASLLGMGQPARPQSSAPAAAAMRTAAAENPDVVKPGGFASADSSGTGEHAPVGQVPAPQPPPPGTAERKSPIPAPSAPRALARLPERRIQASVTRIHTPVTELPGESAATSTTGGAAVAPIASGTGATLLDYVAPWRPRWAAGIMLAATATMQPAKAFDLAAATRRIARGEVLQRFPRARRLTVRLGAQLLVDHGEAMSPFSADRLWLADLVLRIAGREQVRVLRFRSIAERVADGPPLRVMGYCPPMPAVPVVVISDLGMVALRTGRPAGVLPWWAVFLNRLSTTNPVTVISPFPAVDYPPAIRRHALIVPLDRRVTMREVIHSAYRLAGRFRA